MSLILKFAALCRSDLAFPSFRRRTTPLHAKSCSETERENFVAHHAPCRHPAMTDYCAAVSD
jgi:hypothetical protein